MTNADILTVAMRQSALDSGCDATDFLAPEHKVVISRPHPDARRYLDLPFFCDLVTYGTNIVASVSEEIAPFVSQYIRRCPVEHCFETPHLHVLNDELKVHGFGICFMAEYFLPDAERLSPIPCRYPLRLLEPADFADLYQPPWSNALCEKRRELDRLAVGAYDGGTLIGLAGASADCDTMWQIGIDVLPAYRRQGVASALTSRLAAEILACNLVPFYCCAWSNIPSARNALRSGFRPAWVELTAKPLETIERMNG